MKEDKDRQRKVSTCLEGSACAEMMQKIMGEQGMGPFGEEMMRSLMDKCCQSGAETSKAGGPEKTTEDPDKDQGSK